MQTTLIPKINSIINQVYECLVQVQSEKTQNMLKKIGQQIKNFMKEEQSTILKDIAKKTKQLFVLSSDNESLREKLQHLDNNIKRLNEKVAQKQKSIIKLMNDKEREKREIQEKCNEALDVTKKQIAHLEVKIFQNEARFKGEMSDLRRIHKEEMAQNIARQQQIAQNNLERLRLDFAEQKRSMIQAQNKQRSELIKKYQIKLQDLRDKNEQQVYKLTNQHKQRQQKDRKIKADLNNGLFTSENTIKRLQGQLSRQSMCHQKFKSLSQSLTSQLQALHNQHTKTVSELNKKIQTSSSQYQKTQRKLKQQYRQLQQLFQTTIKQKDLLFEETVSTMQNQHHDILESTKSHLLEEKQIAINQTQTKHYTEMEKLNMQHFRLENQFKQLKDSYKTVQKKYQDKIVKLVEDYEGTILSISSRKDYQLGLEGQTAKKNLEVIQRKYKLQIRSLKKQYEDLKQQLTKKISDQRISTTNKLTTHYQSIINQIKISNDVAMKQKLIEFEKKSKAYEKKLSEAQKRRVDLKIQMDRMKLDMQMKIDSLSQLNEKFQLEIQELHHHIVKMEKQRTSIVNQYDFKLLVKKNQLQQVKDQYEIKEKQLRNVFNEHIRVKNAQIQRFSQRVSEKIEQLVKKNARTVELIQKQYNQLKNIVGQRTSLPQDVEALKIFYKGYQKLQEELEKQRQIKNNIQRQLHSKCAIEKVFVAKSFTQRIQQPSPIKILTTRQFHKKDDKLIKFKSQNF